MRPSVLAWLALVVYGTPLATEHTKEDRLPYTVTRQTAAGAVRGIVTSTGFQEFHGVRFAQPPVGPLRWRASLPPKIWDGVFDATKQGFNDIICPQADVVKGGWKGDEDCLVLSVYVPPQCTEATPCPVMQWIYGGAWISGSNDYHDHFNGTILASHGVVVVAANYRLDALGWLALKEQADETAGETNGRFGNYGLYDQTLALKWTAANIHAFGGDPLQVTLFGASAGGFSVCQHLVMPMSNGLFNKAIMQSGSCDGPYGIGTRYSSTNFGDRYAEMIGCPADASGNFTARMECLRALPASDVLVPYNLWFCNRIAKNTSPWCIDYDSNTNPPGIVPPMAPVVGFFAAVDKKRSVLGQQPLKWMQNGKINRGPKREAISVIFGHNEDEMAFFIRGIPIVAPKIDLPLPVSDLSFTKIVEYLAAYNPTWNASAVQGLEDLIYPNRKLYQNAYRLNQFGTDVLFRCGTRRAARVLAAAGLNVYLYNFGFHFDGYKDPNSLDCQLGNEVNCGVYHSSEVKYVFSKDVPDQTQDQAVAALIGRYWTNFARFGSPNEPKLPMWPRYNATSLPRFRHLEFTPAGTAEPSSELREAACDAIDALDPYTAPV